MEGMRLGFYLGFVCLKQTLCFESQVAEEFGVFDENLRRRW
jgi:hypothetical protein